MKKPWVVSFEFEEGDPTGLPPGRRIFRERDYRTSVYVPLGIAGYFSAAALWLRCLLYAVAQPWKIGRHGGELFEISNGLTFYSSASSRLVVYLRVANVSVRLRVRSKLVSGRRVLLGAQAVNPYHYICCNMVNVWVG